MALDGITVAALVRELNDTLAFARLTKIAQTEPDELLLTFKGQAGQVRLLLSANASLPLLYITQTNKQAPATAPGFCMLLRKHIAGGRVVSVTQPGLERIVVFELEHLDELGDVCRKRLIIELMGKHSNIIFTNDKDVIIDSIKHIPSGVSSVREVLPGRSYFIPNTLGKHMPEQISRELFVAEMSSRGGQVAQALNRCLTGISPLIAHELCRRAGFDGDTLLAELSPEQTDCLYRSLRLLIDRIKAGSFTPGIYYRGEELLDFSPLKLSLYEGETFRPTDSVSAAMEMYYAEKSIVSRIRQKSADLRHIVQLALERNVKKYDLQKKQLKDTEKRDKYKVYGELIQIYGYELKPGDTKLTAPNYHEDDKLIDISLDPTLSPMENAIRYFERYNKLKRTHDAMLQQIDETSAEITYLRSVSVSLDMARAEEDLAAIKAELQLAGYIKKARTQGKKKEKLPGSSPYHYRSADGFDMYVGKNNLQNDELTFHLAEGGDWWFHAKGIPGSHVIVKAKGAMLPDRTFEQAAALAAYYSSAEKGSKTEVDYVQRKHLRKPPAAKPGFVIYHTNYSLMTNASLEGIEEVN